MKSPHRLADVTKRTARRQRSARPTCEGLEGRALMAAYSALDPTFGQGGLVLGAATDADLTDGTAVAIEASTGKVVEAGRTLPQSSGLLSQLAVRRFNADGSVDTGFGSGGQATIPLPAGALGVAAGPRNVVVQADGSILVAATLIEPGGGPNSGSLNPSGGVVAKLTATGVLDTSFGSGGQYVIAGPTTSASSVAVDTTGNVLVLGGDNSRDPVQRGQAQSPTANRLVLTRLTPAGVPDTSFNSTGSLAIELPANQLDAGADSGAISNIYNYQATALAIAAGGQIYVAGNDVVSGSSLSSYYANLTRVNADGTLDATFGAGGTVTVGQGQGDLGSVRPSIEAMAFDNVGNLVVVGNTLDSFFTRGLINRFLADGTLDPTFAGNSRTGPAFPQESGLSYDAVSIGDGAINVGASFPFGEGGAVVRFTPGGFFDGGFGVNGLYRFRVAAPAPEGQAVASTAVTVAGIATTADGEIVVAGNALARSTTGSSTRSNLVARLQVVPVFPLTGDYDGDGKSDIAAYLTGPVVYAYRPSAGAAGTPDDLQTFGPINSGAIPVPGDYDGDGKADIAVYVPYLELYFYRGSAGGGDQVIPLYTTNPRDIPAPGDYDGDGKTDAAVYDQSTGSFIVSDSSTRQIRTIPFGAVGTGASIPAPGDYDGDRRTDLAVYLPQYGVFAYRPSSGGPDVLTSFGAPGDRASIPAPGDYDGDGKTDLAVYLPQYAVYAYRPSTGGPDVLTSFGVTGDGGSVPSPGDYDGDGRYDLAVYIPQYALFAYRPSGAVAASSDALTNFGTVGAGATVPASSIPYAQAPTVSGQSLASSGGVDVPLSLFDEALETLTGVKKKRGA